ncbi:hypothetical protein AVEN_222809-1 [Araneus ventricosus]|uniref:Uncharacterized protein n=1 Tax=Araneus ventricosus TaxID=182803 RepID=A0A4Y2PR03_ARAVE|nr:hypothetical protein AVEN_122031-1 [Araneus ventricosus]GBN53721.1 hypothetical protein AVEN_141303-1 [Araneus ventricosus]GBN53724.1 hypothetical protein AVEN_149301-1 [Araneus ventricosus]GBN53764.1 hypothetical protein AVEN_222809-1 [Araneus ventricosus]
MYPYCYLLQSGDAQLPDDFAPRRGYFDMNYSYTLEPILIQLQDTVLDSLVAEPRLQDQREETIIHIYTICVSIAWLNSLGFWTGESRQSYTVA